MTKGILMIALGHQQYKLMAYTLAASIRANDPDLKICLATDKPVESRFAFLFDTVKIIPEKMYTVAKKKEYIRAKLCGYELSPYDATIFLDVDQVLLNGKKISQLFDQLADVELTISNTGTATSSVWVDLAEIKEKYGDEPFWNYHSEVMYFVKSDTAKSFFKKAREIYDKSDLKTVTRFAGGRMADELALQIASILTGVYPHKENWIPNFWYVRHPKLSGKYPYQLDGFITYSIGGAKIPHHVRMNYNNLAALYSQKMKLQNSFKAKDKRSFLPERSKI